MEKGKEEALRELLKVIADNPSLRVKSYLNGKFTGAEQLYLGTDQAKSLARFRAAYPEHDKCILVAEPYESDDNKEHFAACLRCGCVN